MAKKYNKRIVRGRHKFFVWLALRLIAPFIKLKTGFRAKSIKKKPKTPYIVVSNHVTAFDPILVSMSLREQVYYIASELIFSKGFISRVLEYTFSPIPKAKSQADFGAVKQIIKVVREGGNVGIFVEGNSTMNGAISNIPTSIGKLVLLLKIPLVIFNFKGGYLSNPRWSRKKRKRYNTGYVKEIISYEDYKDLSAEEINNRIIKGIDVNAYVDRLDFAYKGKKIAEGLERLIFTCPSCHEPNRIKTDGNMYNCSNCGFKMTYDEYGYCYSSEFKDAKDTVVLDKENKLAYQSYILNNPDYSFSVIGKWFEIMQRHRKTFGKAKLTFNQKGIAVCYNNRKIEDKFYPLDKLDTIAMQQKEMVIIYIKDEETKGFLLDKDSHISAYQFVVTCQIFKNIDKFKKNKQIPLALAAEEMGL